MTSDKLPTDGIPGYGPSAIRTIMDFMQIGSKITLKDKSDMAEEKRRAQVVASNLYKTGKRFSVKWANLEKTEVLVTRVERKKRKNAEPVLAIQWQLLEVGSRITFSISPDSTPKRKENMCEEKSRLKVESFEHDRDGKFFDVDWTTDELRGIEFYVHREK